VEPLVKAAALAAALSALIRGAEVGLPPLSPPTLVASGASEAGSELRAQCPSGTLPDGRVCIPVPRQGAGEPLEAEQAAHRDKTGQWRTYDQIPRRPDRPRSYRAYRYPVPVPKGQAFVASGYDLDRPDSQQRRGEDLKAVGHGGIDIHQSRGTEVRLVNLEHQVGDAEVLFVGELFGNSVVTRHAVREGGRLRDYVVIYGHLEGPAPGLAPGMNTREGSLLGFVGDSGAPGDVHLHLEVRRVREGVNAAELSARGITQNSKTVVCDPRNVMPLN
jgi:murein DD-endopeptidase MepM/ murein hydrolase activator NlpD